LPDVGFNGLTVTHTITTQITSTRIKQTVFIVGLGCDYAMTSFKDLIVDEPTHSLSKCTSQWILLARRLLTLFRVRTNFRRFPRVGERIGCLLSQSTLKFVIVFRVLIVVTTETLDLACPAGAGSHVDLSSTIPEDSQRLVTLVPSNHEEESNLVDDDGNLSIVVRNTHVSCSTTVVCPSNLSVFEHGVGDSVPIVGDTDNDTSGTSYWV